MAPALPAASYFLAGATMTGGTITVEGCGSDSLQVGAPHSQGERCHRDAVPSPWHRPGWGRGRLRGRPRCARAWPRGMLARSGRKTGGAAWQAAHRDRRPAPALQGDVRFAEVMGLMGAKVEWAPYSITITGASGSGLCGCVYVYVCVCARVRVLFCWGGGGQARHRACLACEATVVGRTCRQGCLPADVLTIGHHRATTHTRTLPNPLGPGLPACLVQAPRAASSRPSTTTATTSPTLR